MVKKTDKVKIFEAYVLRTISFQFIILGVIYFFYKDWRTGIIVIIVSLLFGGIGQGLRHNEEKDFKQLLKGQDFDIIGDAESDVMTDEETRLITKPFIFTSWIVTASSVFILFHHNYHWYSAIPLGFAIGIFYPLLLFIAGLFWQRRKLKC